MTMPDPAPTPPLKPLIPAPEPPTAIQTLEKQLPAALEAAVEQPDVTHKIVAIVAILCLPFLNALLSKFGFPSVSSDQVITGMLAIVGIVVSHVAESAHARNLAAAQANAPTPVAAVANLNRGIQP
jgi:hypothetical protein